MSGATHQPNNWSDSWADFWDEYRIGHMIKLCKADGFSIPNEKELRLKVRDILSDHNCLPSYVHGNVDYFFSCIYDHLATMS